MGLLDGRITPPNRFFVRDHFAPPEVPLESWRLRIEGRVEQPFELSYSDLVESPGRKLEAVLECAGNVAGGSAVSNGVWEGVPVRALLEAAKPGTDATVVLLEGADSGRLFEHHPSLPYRRLVPLAKCLEPQSLVAFKLNDQALPARNGFPARAMFPGWYGMDSVKWLRRMVVLRAGEDPADYQESGMPRLYNRIDSNGGSERLTPLTNTRIKSAISWPNQGMRLPASRHLIWGFAWGGTGGVREVLVSTDGGKVWKPAKFAAAASPYTWVRWAFEWQSSPGEHVILSRASDQTGTTQPLGREAGRKDQYELNWCAPIHCSVR